MYPWLWGWNAAPKVCFTLNWLLVAAMISLVHTGLLSERKTIWNPQTSRKTSSTRSFAQVSATLWIKSFTQQYLEKGNSACARYEQPSLIGEIGPIVSIKNTRNGRSWIPSCFLLTWLVGASWCGKSDSGYNGYWRLPSSVATKGIEIFSQESPRRSNESPWLRYHDRER